MKLDIYSIIENDEIECKEAAGGLPKDLWESYSAFANTNGGAILLGIKEKKGAFYPVGVENADKLIVDERKVIDYINKNKFINTKLCKLNLGFGKTKSVEIFNKLMRLNIIRRVGNGSKIRYELINKEIED